MGCGADVKERQQNSGEQSNENEQKLEDQGKQILQNQVEQKQGRALGEAKQEVEQIQVEQKEGIEQPMELNREPDADLPRQAEEFVEQPVAEMQVEGEI